LQIKSFITSVGLGMVAGAAAILMVPKHSDAYRIADDTVHSIKKNANKMISGMQKD